MKRSLVRVCGILVSSGAVACGSATDIPKVPDPEVPKFTCLANSATMRLPADLRATLPTFGLRTPDDAFTEISRTAPGGFGGIFIEGKTHWVLLFVDPAAANAARDQVKHAFETLAPGGGPPVDWVRAEFRGARWSFADLDEWYRYIYATVWQPGSGVSFTDINERANTINIGVIDETARKQLESRLASLNVSCNLVTTEIRAYVTIDR